MSYVALATDEFESMAHFYGHVLGFPAIASWDRNTGRGRRYCLGDGLRLELLDNRRERRPLDLGCPRDRLHLVVEVDDIDAVRHHGQPTPRPTTVSWGARLIQLRDPDGTHITFLQWDEPAT